MKTGLELIAEERHRQVAGENWTPQHDDEHDAGELAAAASAYAMNAACLLHPMCGTPLESPPIVWPWDAAAWKPKEPIRDLVRAGALIAAEIDRLQRKGKE